MTKSGRRVLLLIFTLAAPLAAALANTRLSLAFASLLCAVLAAWAINPRKPSRQMSVDPAPKSLTRAETWRLGLPYVSADGELQWAPENWKDPESALSDQPTPEQIHAAIHHRRFVAERAAEVDREDREVLAKVTDRQRPKVLIVRRDSVLYAESTVTGQSLPLPVGWTVNDYGLAIMFREVKDPRHVFVLPSGVTTNPHEIRDLFDRITRLHH